MPTPIKFSGDFGQVLKDADAAKPGIQAALSAAIVGAFSSSETASGINTALNAMAEKIKTQIFSIELTPHIKEGAMASIRNTIKTEKIEIPVTLSTPKGTAPSATTAPAASNIRTSVDQQLKEPFIVQLKSGTFELPQVLKEFRQKGIWLDVGFKYGEQVNNLKAVIAGLQTAGVRIPVFFDTVSMPGMATAGKVSAAEVNALSMAVGGYPQKYTGTAAKGGKMTPAQYYALEKEYNRISAMYETHLAKGSAWTPQLLEEKEAIKQQLTLGIPSSVARIKGQAFMEERKQQEQNLYAKGLPLYQAAKETHAQEDYNARMARWSTEASIRSAESAAFMDKVKIRAGEDAAWVQHESATLREVSRVNAQSAKDLEKNLADYKTDMDARYKAYLRAGGSEYEGGQRRAEAALLQYRRQQMTLTAQGKLTAPQIQQIGFTEDENLRIQRMMMPGELAGERGLAIRQRAARESYAGSTEASIRSAESAAFMDKVKIRAGEDAAWVQHESATLRSVARTNAQSAKDLEKNLADYKTDMDARYRAYLRAGGSEYEGGQRRAEAALLQYRNQQMTLAAQGKLTAPQIQQLGFTEDENLRIQRINIAGDKEATARVAIQRKTAANEKAQEARRLKDHEDAMNAWHAYDKKMLDAEVDLRDRADKALDMYDVQREAKDRRAGDARYNAYLQQEAKMAEAGDRQAEAALLQYRRQQMTLTAQGKLTAPQIQQMGFTEDENLRIQRLTMVGDREIRERSAILRKNAENEKAAGDRRYNAYLQQEANISRASARQADIADKALDQYEGKQRAKAARATQGKDFAAGFGEMVVRHATWVASGLAMYKTLEVAGDAFKRSVEAREEMGRMAAVTQIAPEKLEGMNKALRDMQSVFPTQELREATTELLKMGVGIENGIPQIDKLSEALQKAEVVARVEGIAIGDVTKQIASIAMSFGIPAESVEKVMPGIMDKVAAVANVTRASMTSIRESILRVGPAAQEFGLDLDQTIGILAMFQQHGMEATTAGTSLRTLLTRLQDPPKELSVIFEKLNQHFGTSFKQGMNFYSAIQQLHSIWPGLTEDAQGYIAANMGLNRNVLGVILSIRNFNGELQKYINISKNATGTVDTMATAMETPAQSLKRLQKNWGDFLESLGNTQSLFNLTAIFGGLADSLRFFRDGLDKTQMALNALDAPEWLKNMVTGGGYGIGKASKEMTAIEQQSAISRQAYAIERDPKITAAEKRLAQQSQSMRALVNEYLKMMQQARSEAGNAPRGLEFVSDEWKFYLSQKSQYEEAKANLELSEKNLVEFRRRRQARMSSSGDWAGTAYKWIQDATARKSLADLGLDAGDKDKQVSAGLPKIDTISKQLNKTFQEMAERLTDISVAGEKAKLALGTAFTPEAGSLIDMQIHTKRIAEFADQLKKLDSLRQAYKAKLQGMGEGWPSEDITKAKFGPGGSSIGIAKAAVESMAQMIEAAQKEGIKLVIGSGYRTYKEQLDLWNKSDKTGRLVAPPGTSMHEKGRAFDFQGGYDWLKKHAQEYGFEPYAPEPWHYTYRKGQPSGAGAEATRAHVIPKLTKEQQAEMRNIRGDYQEVLAGFNKVDAEYIRVKKAQDAEAAQLEQDKVAKLRWANEQELKLLEEKQKTPVSPFLTSDEEYLKATAAFTDQLEIIYKKRSALMQQQETYKSLLPPGAETLFNVPELQANANEVLQTMYNWQKASVTHAQDAARLFMDAEREKLDEAIEANATAQEYGEISKEEELRRNRALVEDYRDSLRQKKEELEKFLQDTMDLPKGVIAKFLGSLDKEELDKFLQSTTDLSKEAIAKILDFLDKGMGSSTKRIVQFSHQIGRETQKAMKELLDSLHEGMNTFFYDMITQSENMGEILVNLYRNIAKTISNELSNAVMYKLFPTAGYQPSALFPNLLGGTKGPSGVDMGAGGLSAEGISYGTAGVGGAGGVSVGAGAGAAAGGAGLAVSAVGAATTSSFATAAAGYIGLAMVAAGIISNIAKSQERKTTHEFMTNVRPKMDAASQAMINAFVLPIMKWRTEVETAAGGQDIHRIYHQFEELGGFEIGPMAAQAPFATSILKNITKGSMQVGTSEIGQQWFSSLASEYGNKMLEIAKTVWPDIELRAIQDGMSIQEEIHGLIMQGGQEAIKFAQDFETALKNQFEKMKDVITSGNVFIDKMAAYIRSLLGIAAPAKAGAATSQKPAWYNPNINPFSLESQASHAWGAVNIPYQPGSKEWNWWISRGATPATGHTPGAGGIPFSEYVAVNPEQYTSIKNEWMQVQQQSQQPGYASPLTTTPIASPNTYTPIVTSNMTGSPSGMTNQQMGQFLFSGGSYAAGVSPDVFVRPPGRLSIENIEAGLLDMDTIEGQTQHAYNALSTAQKGIYDMWGVLADQTGSYSDATKQEFAQLASTVEDWVRTEAITDIPGIQENAFKAKQSVVEYFMILVQQGDTKAKEVMAELETKWPDFFKSDLADSLNKTGNAFIDFWTKTMIPDFTKMGYSAFVGGVSGRDVTTLSPNFQRISQQLLKGTDLSKTEFGGYAGAVQDLFTNILLTKFPDIKRQAFYAGQSIYEYFEVLLVQGNQTAVDALNEFQGRFDEIFKNDISESLNKTGNAFIDFWTKTMIPDFTKMGYSAFVGGVSGRDVTTLSPNFQRIANRMMSGTELEKSAFGSYASAAQSLLEKITLEKIPDIRKTAFYAGREMFEQLDYMILQGSQVAIDVMNEYQSRFDEIFNDANSQLDRSMKPFKVYEIARSLSTGMVAGMMSYTYNPTTMRDVPIQQITGNTIQVSIQGEVTAEKVITAMQEAFSQMGASVVLTGAP